MNEALTSSALHVWRTPLDFIALIQELNFIGLDPCTVASNPIGARTFYTPAEDGLAQDWYAALGRGGQEGLGYVNSEYGAALPRWTDKVIAEAARGCELTQLTPARTDTRWYRRIIDSAQAVVYLARRITFLIDCEMCARGGGQTDAARWFKVDGRTVYVCDGHAADFEPYPKPIAGAAFPSLLSYWGPNTDRLRAIFGDRGDVRVLRPFEPAPLRAAALPAAAPLEIARAAHALVPLGQTAGLTPGQTAGVREVSR